MTECQFCGEANVTFVGLSTSTLKVETDIFIQIIINAWQYQHTHLYHNNIFLDTLTTNNLCEESQFYKIFMCAVKSILNTSIFFKELLNKTELSAMILEQFCFGL